jgi:hypothetical protein
MVILNPIHVTAKLEVLYTPFTAATKPPLTFLLILRYLFEMQLLDLPLELFQEILSHAIVVRGLKRGLRLRLVNSALFLLSSAVSYKLTYQFRVLRERGQ